MRLDELTTKKLADYKTAASADGIAADKKGDFKKGDKRFSGVIKATKKQFDNDAKSSKVKEATGDQKFDSMIDKIKSGAQDRSKVDNVLGKGINHANADYAAGRTDDDSDKKLMAQFGIEVLTTLKEFCQMRIGPNRTKSDLPDAYPYLLKMYNNAVGQEFEPDESWPADVEEKVGSSEIGDWMADTLLGVSTKDLSDFDSALDTYPPLTEFFIVWKDGPDEFEQTYEDPWKQYCKDVVNLKENNDIVNMHQRLSGRNK